MAGDPSGAIQCCSDRYGNFYTNATLLAPEKPRREQQQTEGQQTGCRIDERRGGAPVEGVGEGDDEHDDDNGQVDACLQIDHPRSCSAGSSKNIC